MIEQKKELKRIFRRYNENKRALKGFTFDPLKGLDFSKPIVKKTRKNANEQAIIEYLDEKLTLEKQVLLVERVLWYFDLEGKGKGDYVRLRWIRGVSMQRVLLECYISESTAKEWDKRIYQLTERILNNFHLWGVCYG